MRLFFLLTLLGSPVIGQTLNLTREVSTRPDGRPLILLRNVSNQPAVAWRWESRVEQDRDHLGPGRGTWAMNDGLRGDRVIAPGEAIEVREVDDADVPRSRWAVIYADGSTAGDAEALEHLLRVRRDTRDAIPYLHQALVEAIANGESPQSLRERVNVNPVMAMMNSAVAVVWTRLRDGKSIAEAGPAILAELDRLAVAVESAKPRIR
jgi:hypothetical protein